jgi:hypothetical protein
LIMVIQYVKSPCIIRLQNREARILVLIRELQIGISYSIRIGQTGSGPGGN